MGQFSVEKPVAPGSVLSGNQQALFALIGKAILFASRARRVIPPILFRVRLQLETRENPARRNEFCRSIIMRKIEATIITLENQFPVPINGSGRCDRLMPPCPA